MTTDYTFPITFDIDKPSKVHKVFGVFIFMQFFILTYVIFRGTPKVMVGVVAFILSLVMSIIVLARKNKDKPAFTIFEDKLVVKKEFGRMKEYPYEMFNKDVYVKKLSLEWFIVLPDNKDRIHIHSLPSEQRDKIITILKELIVK